jgi:hypothetical protein
MREWLRAESPLLAQVCGMVIDSAPLSRVRTCSTQPCASASHARLLPLCVNRAHSRLQPQALQIPISGPAPHLHDLQALTSAASEGLLCAQVSYKSFAAGFMTALWPKAAYSKHDVRAVMLRTFLKVCSCTPSSALEVSFRGCCSALQQYCMQSPGMQSEPRHMRHLAAAAAVEVGGLLKPLETLRAGADCGQAQGLPGGHHAGAARALRLPAALRLLRVRPRHPPRQRQGLGQGAHPPPQLPAAYFVSCSGQHATSG